MAALYLDSQGADVSHYCVFLQSILQHIVFVLGLLFPLSLSLHLKEKQVQWTDEGETMIQHHFPLIYLKRTVYGLGNIDLHKQ